MFRIPARPPGWEARILGTRAGCVKKLATERLEACRFKAIPLWPVTGRLVPRKSQA